VWVHLNNNGMTFERAVRAAVLTCKSQLSLNSCNPRRWTASSTTQNAERRQARLWKPVS